MQELLNELYSLRSDCGAHATRLSTKHALPAHEHPIGGLGICFNAVTLATELTSYYKTVWDSSPTHHLNEEAIEKKRRESTERLMVIGKLNFIHAISGFEFSARRANIIIPKILSVTKKRAYLSDFIKESNARGLVDANVNSLWAGAIRIRNCMVHNNGIADETDKLIFSSNLTIEMEDEKMIIGTIMTFPRLTAWTTFAFADWCDKFLQAR